MEDLMTREERGSEPGVTATTLLSTLTCCWRIKVSWSKERGAGHSRRDWVGGREGKIRA